MLQSVSGLRMGPRYWSMARGKNLIFVSLLVQIENHLIGNYCKTGVHIFII